MFELLVSISIIAILTALATISYSAAQKKARDSRRIQDVESIQKAEEQYFMLSNATYKPGFSVGSSWVVNGATIFVFPTDPKSGWTDYASLATCYYTGPNCTSYCACAKLENLTGNSNVTDCSAWVNGTGQYYCVMSQQ